MPIRLPAAAGLLLLLAGCATPAQHARAFWNGREPGHSGMPGATVSKSR